MARSQKVRLTLDVSEGLNEILEDIAAESGVTKSEVIRKAVAMLDVAHKAAREGKQLTISKDGKIEKQIVGL
ncbi:MAG TPA: hypothetical protein VEI03_05295 [Stellaceae bacterium]|nr:hypothetical protein [Stellaceae bacterium]